MYYNVCVSMCVNRWPKHGAPEACGPPPRPQATPITLRMCKWPGDKANPNQLRWENFKAN